MAHRNPLPNRLPMLGPQLQLQKGRHRRQGKDFSRPKGPDRRLPQTT
jgi:hypothetical protein